jgi:recombination associated protein RdgC
METQIDQLDKILPEDVARTFESAYHVIFQNDYDKVDDLLRNGGTLVKKAAQRFTTTQLILGIAGLAAVAVVVAKKAIEAADAEPETSAEPAPDHK